MLMPPRIARLSLTVHVIASIGWLGALLVFLAHAAVGRLSDDPRVAAAMALAMATAAWTVILPLSLATLASGVLQAMGTAWGLLRHYWVLLKLALTLLATGVLLIKLGPISALADAASAGDAASEGFARTQVSLLAHALGGAAMLLAAAVLAIWKPVGLTRWAAPGVPAPRWVRAGIAIVALGALILAAFLLISGHTPQGGHGT